MEESHIPRGLSRATVSLPCAGTAARWHEREKERQRQGSQPSWVGHGGATGCRRRQGRSRKYGLGGGTRRDVELSAPGKNIQAVQAEAATVSSAPNPAVRLWRRRSGAGAALGARSRLGLRASQRLPAQRASQTPGLRRLQCLPRPGSPEGGVGAKWVGGGKARAVRIRPGASRPTDWPWT